MIEGTLVRELGSINGLGAVIEPLVNLTFVIRSVMIILPSVDLPFVGLFLVVKQICLK